MNTVFLPRLQLAELLNRISLFKSLPNETLGRLAAGAKETRIARNEIVFQKGDPADTLHVVVSGKIRIFLPLADKAFKTLQIAGNGDSFGVAAAWLGERHLAKAQAINDSYLLIVERNALLREAQQNCSLATRLLNRVTEHKLSLLRDMENCAPRSSLQRVSCYLLQYRPDEETLDYEILLPTTKREIADKLSLTQETLSRVLHQLKDMSVIDVQGRLIRVLDSDRLLSVRLSDCPAAPAIP